MLKGHLLRSPILSIKAPTSQRARVEVALARATLEARAPGIVADSGRVIPLKGFRV